MPQSIMIGLLVLGGVLLLVAITGGQFKIFVAEVDTPVSNAPVRIISGILGLTFIAVALVLNKPAAPSAAQTSASNPATAASPSSPSSSTASGVGSGSTSSNGSNGSSSVDRPAPVAGRKTTADSDSDGVSNPPSASRPDSIPVTSSSEYAVVFDPPTNVRSAPTTTSATLCSVTSKTAIRILGSEGNWYQTDICGSGAVGYIYRNQVKF